MKQLFFVIGIAAMLGLTGCASAPQQPVAMTKQTLAPSTRIGIAMTVPPKVDTVFPGANCLLCYAAASVANSSLTTHVQTLSTADVVRIKSDVAAALRTKGYSPVMIEDIKVADLPKTSAGPNKAQRDFSSLGAKYQIDKLVMIEITQLGISRNYAAYIPNGDPQAVITGTGYLVNLANNTYEWYLPLQQAKGASGQWDEAPSYPGLTNAYFQAVEGAHDALLQPFND